MEEILLKLICQEYEVTQEYLFSDARRGKIQEPLNMMTYILSVRYGWETAKIHKFYVSKGSKKGKASLYHHLKKGAHDTHFYEYSRVVLERIVSDVDQARQINVLEDPSKKEIYSVRGRIMTKLTSVKSLGRLCEFEHILDKHLQVNYLQELDA